MFLCNYAKVGQAKMGSQMHINTCTDSYTHSKQGVKTEMGDTHTHKQCHTGAPIIPCNYPKGMELTWGIRWTCIHVLMHVHILTKVWEQNWGH